MTPQKPANTAIYSVEEIVPMDDMILVQVPKPVEKIGRIHVTEKSSVELTQKLSYKVLKLGSLWDVQHPAESGFTEVKIGDELIIGGSIQALTLTDFDYPNNAALVYRSDIRCKLKVKAEPKIIS